MLFGEVKRVYFLHSLKIYLFNPFLEVFLSVNKNLIYCLTKCLTFHLFLFNKKIKLVIFIKNFLVR